MGTQPISAPVVHAGPGAPLCFLNGMRGLLERALDIQQPYWSAAALVHAAAVARDLEHVVRTHPHLTVSRPMGWFASAVGCLSQLGGGDALLRPLADAFSREQKSPRRWKQAAVDRWARAMAGATQYGRPGFLAVARLSLAAPSADLLAVLGNRAAHLSRPWMSDLVARGIATETMRHGLAPPREQFIPELKELEAMVGHFRPSLPMVAALAEAGAFETGRAVAERLSARHRARGMAWLALYAKRRGGGKLFRSFLGQVPVGGQRDRVLGVLAVDAARRGDFDEAGRWLRAVEVGSVRAAAAARVGLQLEPEDDEQGARVYLRQAFACTTAPPEAWALRARVRGNTREAAECIDNAVDALEQRRRYCRTPRVAPPLRPEPNSATVVFREALGLWARTGNDRVLRRFGNAWGSEVAAHPEILAPLLPRADAQSLRRVVAALPVTMRPLLGAALEARAIRREAMRLDPGRALASVRSDTPGNRETMTVLGALLGPAWDGRPPRGPLRVAFDEGASLAPGSKATSRLLARSARRWVEEGMKPDASRADIDQGLAGLRILVNLRGTREKEMIAKWVEEGETGGMMSAMADALVKLWPRRAIALLWQRFWRLSDGGRAALRRFRMLEGGHLVEAGFGQAWDLVQQRLSDLGVSDPARWWDTLARQWWERYGRPIPVVGMQLLADQLEVSPEAALEAFATFGTSLRQRDPVQVATALASSEEELVRLLCLSESAIPVGHRRLSWWKELLTEAQKVPAVDAARVHELVASLSEGCRPERDWSLPRLGFETPVALERGSLRMLDARRDALAYLTAADSAPCCLTLVDKPLGWEARRIALLWRDPLSVMFQLEQETGGVRVATGFVFGSLGWSGGRPVLLLNGVYLRRSKRSLRFEIVDAIEDRWARALGVEGIGIAALHGGHGPLPPDYKVRSVRVSRACGLKGAVDLYDDLCLRTRQPEVVKHLRWKVWGSVDER